MNIQTVTMDKEEAIKQLKVYKSKLEDTTKKKLAKHVEREYEAAIRMLKELGKGHAILDINDVIIHAPIDAKERPKLAISRADVKQIYFRWGPGQNFCSFAPADNQWTNSTTLRTVIAIERMHHYQAIPEWEPNLGLISAVLEGYSLVPLVPPDIKLTAKSEKYHILWEVKDWADTEIGAKPDKDPYLLRKINSTLYAVIAEWNLTEVERMVMKHRSNVE